MKLVRDSEIYADQTLALPRFLFEDQENELFWHARWLRPFLEKHGLYEHEMIQAYKNGRSGEWKGRNYWTHHYEMVGDLLATYDFLKIKKLPNHNSIPLDYLL